MDKTNYSKIIAKVWNDPEFKEELLKNPEETLRSQGVEIPEGVKITVCENTDHLVHLVLPTNPGNLSEEQLEAIAAGGLLADLGGAFVGIFNKEAGAKVKSGMQSWGL